MKCKLIGVAACCALSGCARLLDSRFEASFQALARPEQVLSTADTELKDRGYHTHQIEQRWLSGTQSQWTPLTPPAMAVSIVLFPVAVITWPVALLVASPFSMEFAAWWPVYPLSIGDGTIIHRNVQVSADVRNEHWTVVRIKAKADSRGIRDFKAVHEVLLRTYQTCDPPSEIVVEQAAKTDQQQSSIP